MGKSSSLKEPEESEGRSGQTLLQAGETPKLEDPSSTEARTNDLLALRQILCSGINVLLVAAPLGIASGYGDWDSIIVFSTNFIAMAPLAGILGKATDNLAEHTGQVAGGLISASFGNAVEIIITVDCIKKGLCGVVQAALIGSVLSNLLLVLGMSFFVSGTVKAEARFNKDGAGANSSCLLVAGIGISIPTLFSKEGGADLDAIICVSRKSACIMAFIYCCFLYFQLYTHRSSFEEEDADYYMTEEEKREVAKNSRSSTVREDERYYSREEEEDPLLSLPASTIILIVSVGMIYALSKNMTGSIEAFTTKYDIPKAFVGLVLLPIIGNASEQTTAILAAFKLKMDAAIGVAVGSCNQVALFVVPLSVIVGWAYDQPMTLDFGTFYSGTFLLSVFLVSSVLSDGSSNWLEGLMLIATYTMIATISFFVKT